MRKPYQRNVHGAAIRQSINDLLLYKIISNIAIIIRENKNKSITGYGSLSPKHTRTFFILNIYNLRF